MGKLLVQKLISSPKIESITLLTRRAFNDHETKQFDSPKIRQKIIDFDDLKEDLFTDMEYDTGICTLGTTRADSGAAGKYIMVHCFKFSLF